MTDNNGATGLRRFAPRAGPIATCLSRYFFALLDAFIDKHASNQDTHLMPDRSSNARKRPRDMNQLAKAIVDISVGEAPPDHDPNDGKNPAAVALGRLGGLKGGKARAKKLSAAKRTAIAKKAAIARWKHRAAPP
jgi:hypothetical protein